MLSQTINVINSQYISIRSLMLQIAFYCSFACVCFLALLDGTSEQQRKNSSSCYGMLSLHLSRLPNVQTRKATKLSMGCPFCEQDNKAIDLPVFNFLLMSSHIASFNCALAHKAVFLKNKTLTHHCQLLSWHCLQIQEGVGLEARLENVDTSAKPCGVCSGGQQMSCGWVAVATQALKNAAGTIKECCCNGRCHIVVLGYVCGLDLCWGWRQNSVFQPKQEVLGGWKLLLFDSLDSKCSAIQSLLVLLPAGG